MGRYILTTTVLSLSLFLGLPAKARALADCPTGTSSQIEEFLDTLSKNRDYKGKGTITYYNKSGVRETVTAELGMEKSEAGWEMVWEYCGKGYCSADGIDLALVGNCLHLGQDEILVHSASEKDLSFSRIQEGTKETYKIRITRDAGLHFSFKAFEDEKLESSLTFTGK